MGVVCCGVIQCSGVVFLSHFIVCSLFDSTWTGDAWRLVASSRATRWSRRSRRCTPSAARPPETSSSRTAAYWVRSRTERVTSSLMCVVCMLVCVHCRIWCMVSTDCAVPCCILMCVLFVLYVLCVLCRLRRLGADWAAGVSRGRKEAHAPPAPAQDQLLLLLTISTSSIWLTLLLPAADAAGRGAFRE